MCLHLRDKVNRDCDHNQQRCTPQEDWHNQSRRVRLHNHSGDLRHGHHERQIGGPNDGQSRKDDIQIGYGLFTRPNTRDKAAVLLEVFCGIFRIEHDRRVEERR